MLDYSLEKMFQKWLAEFYAAFAVELGNDQNGVPATAEDAAAMGWDMDELRNAFKSGQSARDEASDQMDAARAMG